MFKLADVRARRVRLGRRHDPPVDGASERRSLNSLPRQHQRGGQSASSTPAVNFGYNTVERADEQRVEQHRRHRVAGVRRPWLPEQRLIGRLWRTRSMATALARLVTSGPRSSSRTCNRLIGASNLNWRPTRWLQTRANVGTRPHGPRRHRLCHERRRLGLQATYRDGSRRNARTNITNLSRRSRRNGELQSVALHVVEPQDHGRQRSTSTTVSDQNNASGTTLPPGASDGQLPVPRRASSEGHTHAEDAGASSSKKPSALRDRLFLTAAVRTDQNSAFGTNFQRVYYPKVSVSWIISDEEFFPRSRHLQPDQRLPPPPRVRRVRRAAGPERRAQDVLGQLGQHQEHRCADRNLQRRRQRRA